MMRHTLGRLHQSVKVLLVRQSSSFTLTRVFTPVDLKRYADLSGDCNPIHLDDDNPIVHGTFLLGVISGIMGTKCPGPGSRVISLRSEFLRPCLLHREIEFRVEITSSRKILECQFNVSDKSHGDILVRGEAKLRRKTTLN
ncbi:hypothetical protein TCAL_00345 [Tigriopus californicus]|uniref:MaoC-like domain-containing protein n=1 Tax=Tigriopus californicus TaxID=6832 RepID=A0A553NCH6_TIGCA|nr:hypothetical protein TCAL_00345 [Tigriopus californicus]|eukprot:TCALIF_00345-PA protein Name:"Similar to RPP14 Hydroxyacyl-thioester dehydratase type 2, mitochondrial (Homo sapiens)" AED:0.43 eAED:0.43 QI:0/-1/0/1/-1/1/1/0/140